MRLDKYIQILLFFGVTTLEVTRLPLTDDSSHVVPDRQPVGLGLLPAIIVAQVERKPEEEGVVDQLQTRISQGVLRYKHGQSHEWWSKWFSSLFRA